MTKLARTSPAALILGAVLCAAPAAAQEGGYAPPRTAYGHPDLQGFWTNQSATDLTRPASVPLEVDAETAARLAADDVWRTAENREAAAQDLALDEVPPAGDATTASFAFEPYNAFWLELGDSLAQVGGQYRTSWIVEPDDGQVPLSEAGRARVAETQARRDYSYLEGGNYSDPEAAPLSERCLIGFSTTGGPVLLDAIYNSNYQIVQTPDHVMILIEMVHDARIIRLNAQHNDAAIKPWFGDSIGWWEGDTLVVETRNINPVHASAGPVYFSDEGVLTERFTRTADDQILYSFEVNDPAYYSQTWRGEIPFRPSAGLYEYACHEGNYAMEGILRGSRLAEARTAGAGEDE